MAPDKTDLSPSIRTILWTDYNAFLAVIIPIAAWLITLAWIPDWRGEGPVIPGFLLPYVFIFDLSFTAICLAALAWRIRTLFSIYRSGSIIPGKIDSIDMKRDHAIVEFAYSLESDRYTARALVHRSQKLKALKAGERVVLLVDRLHPRRAILRDLYISG